MPRTSPRKLSSKAKGDDEATPAASPATAATKPATKSKVKGKAAPKKKVAASAKSTSKEESPKKRKKAAAKNADSDDDDESSSVASTTKVSPKKKVKKTASKKTTTAKATKKKVATKKATTSSGSEDETDGNSATKSPAKKVKKAKAVVQSITERDELPKLWDDDKAKANGSYTLKIATWNVAGLRAVIKKDPEALAKLVKANDIDILCLQETKLQEMHLDDPKLKIRSHLLEAEGYDSYYSCSTAKKGYSGTAVYVKRRGAAKKKDISSFFAKKSRDGDEEDPSVVALDEKLLVPEEISYGLGKEKHDGEGRIIVLDFPGFSMANLYVPNSGQKLERLDYRLQEWDKDLLAFMQERQAKRGVPVMWLGDLNVAHKNHDAYNFGAKHLDKQAGLTPEERAGFDEQLGSGSGFVDAFRELHPEAKGHYTYWSQRAGNRLPNKGLRLDYFVCDKTMFNDDSKVVVRDSYMLPDQLGSDHGPAVLELEIKP